MKGSVVLIVGDAGVARAVLAPRVTSEGLRQWRGRLCGYIPLGGDGGDGRAADHGERGPGGGGKEGLHEGG